MGAVQTRPWLPAEKKTRKKEINEKINKTSFAVVDSFHVNSFQRVKMRACKACKVCPRARDVTAIFSCVRAKSEENDKEGTKMGKKKGPKTMSTYPWNFYSQLVHKFNLPHNGF